MQNRFQLAYLLTWALHAALFQPRTASTYFTTHISWDDEALWFQMDKTRQKYQFFQTSFSRFTVSVSGHWTYFIFKVRQTIAGISVIRQLNEFPNLIFGGFFAICPSCAPQQPTATRRWTDRAAVARRLRRQRNSWTKQELAPIAMRSTTSLLTRNILIFFSLNLWAACEIDGDVPGKSKFFSLKNLIKCSFNAYFLKKLLWVVSQQRLAIVFLYTVHAPL